MQLISVIVPIYNTEKYLSNCLDSILAQTYTNWEAILVNDGSSDNCGEICDEYAKKDCRFKVIHQTNQGVVAARNQAISHSKGDYLAFVDSDDTISVRMIEEMVELAQKKSLDIVWCNLKWIYENQHRIETISINKDNQINIKKILTTELPGYLCNKIIKKSFWESCCIHTDNNATMWEDTYISLQLLANKPQNGYINKGLYNYNKTNENAATSNTNIIVKAFRNIEYIYEYLNKHHIFENYKTEFSIMAMKLKFSLLKTDIDKAFSIFPFAHKRIKFYKLPTCLKLFYFINFNIGFIGKSLFRFYFNYLKRK